MNYTELLTEYVTNNGGVEQAFPRLFQLVPSKTVTGNDLTETVTFSNAFLLNFCDREIGFETEELFALKLEARAEKVLPYYIERIQALDAFKTLSATHKTVHEFDENNTRTPDLTSANSGGVRSDDYKYPDSGKTLNDGFLSETNNTTDTTTTKTTGTDKSEHGGKNTDIYELTALEVIEARERLNKDITSIYSLIFKEFESLFMQVL